MLCFGGCSFEELKEELHGWPVAATWRKFTKVHHSGNDTRKIVKLMVWRWLPPKAYIHQAAAGVANY